MAVKQINTTIYGKVLDKNGLPFKAFSKKKFFKLDEFACILANIDPLSFDDSFKSGAEFDKKVGLMLRLLREEEKEPESLDDWYVPIKPLEFCGFPISELGYPVQAFKEFCSSRGIPYPLPDDSTPQQPKVIAKDDYEIIEGVTVGDMRKIFGRGAPLDDIIKHLVKYSTFKPESKNEEILFSGLNAVAKKSGWGMATDRGLSKPQKTGIDMLFFPNCAGGRGKAKDYTI